MVDNELLLIKVSGVSCKSEAGLFQIALTIKKFMIKILKKGKRERTTNINHDKYSVILLPFPTEVQFLGPLKLVVYTISPPYITDRIDTTKIIFLALFVVLQSKLDNGLQMAKHLK